MQVASMLLCSGRIPVNEVFRVQGARFDQFHEVRVQTAAPVAMRCIGRVGSVGGVSTGSPFMAHDLCDVDSTVAGVRV